MTCIYFHCYHSFYLAPYNPPLTVWHWRKVGPTQEYPASIISGAHTDSITYPGMSKLN